MAILHPLECYLLEKFSSPEHFAATRDAIIAFIDAHEAAYTRYQQELPVRTRSEPLWKQGDVVWGSRVLPNIRPSREQYINAYILRTHNNPEAFRIGHTMNDFNRNICEFWNGWMTDKEKKQIARAEGEAYWLDKVLTMTVSGKWSEGDLTYFQGDLYQLAGLPKRIPRYELDLSVRVEKGERPVITGIYLPDVEQAPAQLLYPGVKYGNPPTCRQGIKRKDTVNRITGKYNYNWLETRWAETGWTLIRRVEGEYLDVPPEGFFPNKTPDELYTWPEREKDYITREGEYISAWSGELSPHSGDWSMFTGSEMKYASVGQGQALPYLTSDKGSPQRVCWTLIKRDDNGSVFRTK
ncbi:type VI secretion protein ImpA [Enterobacter cancerogenus]|uniref:type VI secretion protein ImpA n=1 Tax=Enterobacter cancerogenus TaxID=69218 RepID=UPI000C75659C|nr:type VI secretion protein ImpA [Enterobacter cancerogenus]AUJ83356.1 type VI secretion protein ImpA [Enterobacter cancerogenus]